MKAEAVLLRVILAMVVIWGAVAGIIQHRQEITKLKELHAWELKEAQLLGARLAVDAEAMVKGQCEKEKEELVEIMNELCDQRVGYLLVHYDRVFEDCAWQVADGPVELTPRWRKTSNNGG